MNYKVVRLDTKNINELEKVYKFFGKYIIEIKEQGQNSFALVCQEPLAKTLILQVKGSPNYIKGAILGGMSGIVLLSAVRKKAGRKDYSSEHLLYGDKVRELNLLAVEPTSRNRGLATSLITQAEAIYRRKGVEYLYGGINDPDNQESLATFYEKQGYTVSQTLPQMFDLDWGDEVMNPYSRIEYTNLPLYIHKRL